MGFKEFLCVLFNMCYFYSIDVIFYLTRLHLIEWYLQSKPTSKFLHINILIFVIQNKNQKASLKLYNPLYSKEVDSKTKNLFTLGTYPFKIVFKILEKGEAFYVF